MVAIVYSEKFLQHETGGHPERKERLIAIIDFLQKKGFQQFNKPLEISEKDLLLVHKQGLINDVKRLSGEAVSTGDNVFNKNTFEIAQLACGAALKAAELSEKEFAFSLARPPGHHAGSNFFGGFCYFNNIAFAVRAMQRRKGIGRAMIVDFDLHCGNGTEEIFYNDKSVFYLSLHQDPAFTFPGTGFESENNAHVRNVPLNAGVDDAEYLRLFEKNFNECFGQAQPNLLAVSAGFDIFASDAGVVGTQLAVEKPATFNAIGKIISGTAKENGVPCFAVLEGGYDLHSLPLNVFNFLNAFK